MLQKLKDCAALFTKCFPMMSVSESVISRKLSGTDMFFRYENGELIGFSAVEGESLLLVCVHPDYQGKGHGTSLLCEAEEFIRNNAGNRVILGRSSRDLFWGAVINSMSHRFFEKRGYTAYNGCLSMYLYTEDFSYDRFTEKYPVPDGIRFCISREGLPEDIYDAVEKTEPNWLRFYRERSDAAVITVHRGEKTIGFMTADTDAHTIITEDGYQTGLIGYLGIIPEERNKGNGISMLAFAIDFMKSEGCTEIFVNYTSEDQWYARAGFEEYLWYWMGEKSLGYMK